MTTLYSTIGSNNAEQYSARRLRGLFLMDGDAFDLVYAGPHYVTISNLVDLVGPPQTRESILNNSSLLSDVDVIFSGWGMARMDDSILDNAPNLRAIFYGAGATSYFTTQKMWDRGIVVTSAVHANSIPVAEYTLATILFSLKHGWSLARETRDRKCFVPRNGAPGAYRSTVGIVSLGEVARLVINYLKPFDVEIIAYDPYVNDSTADELGVKRVSLQELFSVADVVTLHTPALAETQHLITGKLIRSMKPKATLINTSRGSIIHQSEMISVLTQRPDLQAILDVCEPEPPLRDSPLYSLPNVVLTPHIAGSVGQECNRMGQYMVDELKRYLANEPLLWQIRPERCAHNSNRTSAMSISQHSGMVDQILAM